VIVPGDRPVVPPEDDALVDPANGDDSESEDDEPELMAESKDREPAA
jgi:hypothetical protein